MPPRPFSPAFIVSAATLAAAHAAPLRVLELRPGADAVASITAAGGRILGAPAGLSDVVIVQWPEKMSPRGARRRAAVDASVARESLLVSRPRSAAALPNDPFFPRQWHLDNTGQLGGVPGTDVNVATLWGTFGGSGTRGAGVRVGIIDDGVQTTHPDLVADAASDADWNDETPDDANPALATDNHGTCVAGIVAATANNAYGVSGVAPEVTVVGERLIGGDTPEVPANPDDWQEARALSHLVSAGPLTLPIKNSSWGVPAGAPWSDGPGPLTRAALRLGGTFGREGRGTVHVFAAGNGGSRLAPAAALDSNRNGYANSPWTMAVSAIDETGKVAFYSEGGANVLVCAPGGGSVFGKDNIVTTDRTGAAGFNPGSATSDGNFTVTFAGTSAAAPVVSGVCALVLQTRPELGWRDVQEILVRTARKLQPADAGWITNGAGFHFHPDYGAGLVDAQAACTLAATWTPLGAWKMATADNSDAAPVPDGSPSGLTRPFSLAGTGLRAERVTLRLRASHPLRGQLAVALTSPAGTRSVLAPVSAMPLADYADWTFSTVQMWGEPADGTWTLSLVDATAGSAGAFENATLTVLGTSAVPDAWETWRAAHFTPAELADGSLEATIWGDAADPDADGFANAAECAFGTDPRRPDAPAPWSTVVEDGALVLTWPKPARTDVAIVPQWSGDLETWRFSDERIAGEARPIVVTSTASTQSARLSPSGLATAALRLRIARQLPTPP